MCNSRKIIYHWFPITKQTRKKKKNHELSIFTFLWSSYKVQYYKVCYQIKKIKKFKNGHKDEEKLRLVQTNYWQYLHWERLHGKEKNLIDKNVCMCVKFHIHIEEFITNNMEKTLCTLYLGVGVEGNDIKIM